MQQNSQYPTPNIQTNISTINNPSQISNPINQQQNFYPIMQPQQHAGNQINLPKNAINPNAIPQFTNILQAISQQQIQQQIKKNAGRGRPKSISSSTLLSSLINVNNMNQKIPSNKKTKSKKYSKPRNDYSSDSEEILNESFSETESEPSIDIESDSESETESDVPVESDSETEKDYEAENEEEEEVEVEEEEEEEEEEEDQTKSTKSTENQSKVVSISKKEVVSTNQQNNTPKRGPGRPRKELPQEDVVKRKVGRPKKNQSPSNNNNNQKQIQLKIGPEKVKRKPGRPRKNQLPLNNNNNLNQVKVAKKRGRPKKEKNVDVPIEPPKLKRKVGRPPKSSKITNKPEEPKLKEKTPEVKPISDINTQFKKPERALDNLDSWYNRQLLEINGNNIEQNKKKRGRKPKSDPSQKEKKSPNRKVLPSVRQSPRLIDHHLQKEAEKEKQIDKLNLVKKMLDKRLEKKLKKEERIKKLRETRKRKLQQADQSKS